MQSDSFFDVSESYTPWHITQYNDLHSNAIILYNL